MKKGFLYTILIIVSFIVLIFSPDPFSVHFALAYLILRSVLMIIEGITTYKFIKKTNHSLNTNQSENISLTVILLPAILLAASAITLYFLRRETNLFN